MLKAVPRFVVFAVLLSLCGCGQFFPPINNCTSNCPSTGANYIYAANGNTLNIAGFTISSTAINTISGSPFSFGVTPSALAITPSNTYLYAATLSGGIFGYSIGTGGILSVINSGSAVVTGVSPSSIAVDTTGKWLIAVDATPSAYIFSINSDGTVTSSGSVPLVTGTNPNQSPNHMMFTPNDNFLYVSLGNVGVIILTFNSSTGVLTNNNQVLPPKKSVDAMQGLAVNTAGTYLYVAETGLSGVRVLSINATTGALTEITGSPYTTGTGPAAVLLDSTGSYLYVANRAANTISAFLVSSSGALTQISGSPFAAGTNPIDMTEDNTHTYICVVNAGGSPDLQTYTILTSVPGALEPFKSAATGTDPTNALAIAAAH